VPVPPSPRAQTGAEPGGDTSRGRQACRAAARARTSSTIWNANRLWMVFCRRKCSIIAITKSRVNR